MFSKSLVVDLDGTVLRSDILLESGIAYLKAKPHRFYRPLFWLLKGGKAHLKTRLSDETNLDVAALPYDRRVLDWLHAEKATGREIVLATASHQRYADLIADHLGIFDRTLASDANVNLSSGKKRDRLVQEFGEKGFDYAGNSRDDLAVWRSADRAIVVNPAPGVERKAKAIGNVDQTIETRPGKLQTWRKALRMHQWLKNLLIFVPALTAHQFDAATFGVGLLAFLFFGLCASSVYILNDLLDLEDDRHHSSKRHRPFASGALSLKAGLLAFPLLLCLAFGGATLLLPWRYAAVLAGYYVLTLGYSLAWKRMMMVDVVALAMLYTIRIIAGTAAFALLPTFWLLAFSMFMFLSLALVKRYAELLPARHKGESKKTRGRGYYPGDLEMLASLGAASGYLAVLVMALYIQDGATTLLYRHPRIIWLACPVLLFWISRTWLLTHRGKMNDDPVVFAAKDWCSLALGALFTFIFWLAV